MHKNTDDIIGHRFGRLIVTGWAGSAPDRKALWHVRCDCGAEKITKGYTLRSGQINSCGCGKKRHGGMAGGRATKEYAAWANMMNRCNRPTTPNYKFYGGRGIRVCARWRKFENFLADIGAAPTKAHTLDRIDNGTGYKPGNVRWATRKEQQNNIRSNKKITINGETLNLVQAVKKYGAVSYDVAHGRTKRGWDLVDAVTTPLLKRGSDYRGGSLIAAD